MLIINNIKFAKNDKEFTNSLFETGNTAYGFYKKLKGRIHLMDMQRNIFAAVVVNNQDFKAIVNAVKLDGKTHYQHGASDITEKLLGVPSGYIARRDYAETIFNSLEA